MTVADVKGLVAAELDRQFALQRRDYGNELFLTGATEAKIAAGLERCRAAQARLRPGLLVAVQQRVIEQMTIRFST
jgi:hypothetical protein